MHLVGQQHTTIHRQTHTTHNGGTVGDNGVTLWTQLVNNNTTTHNSHCVDHFGVVPTTHNIDRVDGVRDNVLLVLPSTHTETGTHNNNNTQQHTTEHGCSLEACERISHIFYVLLALFALESGQLISSQPLVHTTTHNTLCNTTTHNTLGRISQFSTTIIQSGRLRFNRRGASTPLWGVEACSPPSRRPNPIPAIPPYVVRTPHLHGAPTTEETVKL